MSARRVTLAVTASAAGMRLDTLLAAELPELTRSAWKRLIEERRVTIDGRAIGKAGLPVKEGMALAVELPERETSGLTGEAIPLEVLYEDGAIAVVVKPAGLVVHPGHGARRGTLVHALLGRGMTLAPAGGADRPGIVHRLDKGTSGVLVVAKTDAAHRALAAAFARREVNKTYRALVWGRPQPPAGRIEDAIGRSRSDRTKMTVSAKQGRPATTVYRTVGSWPGFALLDVDLVTGRTHQIRVHFAARRHPVIGDTRYGGTPWKTMRDPVRRAAIAAFPRLALHALRIAFVHPVTGAAVAFEAPVPPEIDALVGAVKR
ncbi:MAG TPA: RluA family pseudouridine synthase [Candidatus Polarisedimenticolaceae bacterium]|nr:RluA family pseudouridine synthase [Candidatus Polarisedimenticolaceae bacterium]